MSGTFHEVFVQLIIKGAENGANLPTAVETRANQEIGVPRSCLGSQVLPGNANLLIGVGRTYGKVGTPMIWHEVLTIGVIIPITVETRANQEIGVPGKLPGIPGYCLGSPISRLAGDVTPAK